MGDVLAAVPCYLLCYFVLVGVQTTISAKPVKTHSASGHVVTDFTLGEDKLSFPFSALFTFEEFLTTATEVDGSTVINFSGDEITLIGVPLASLSESDVIFPTM